MYTFSRLAGLIIAGCCLASSSANAQSAILTLPDVSQHARTLQRVGLTDITIDYHRPLVSGRKIFGGLEPLGEVWRAGANSNTTFEVSDPVTIQGQSLPKGIYGLHMIPGDSSWVVVFSRNYTSWGSFSYDSTEDALRVTVKPTRIELHEALSYEFDDPKPASVMVTMRWERVAVSLDVKVNTPELVAQSLRRQLRSRAQSEWQAWEEVANYFLENKLSADEAAKYAARSIQIEDRFENEFTKARALRALGRQDEAAAAQTRALAIATPRQVYDFGRGLQRLGQQAQALEIFRQYRGNDPNSWIAHNEAARVAVGAGDYDTAVSEMKRAVSAAPEGLKSFLGDLVRQLQNKVDINR
ncbi:MAG: DUF2911 domain-containing protein [bacterium]